MRKIWMFSILVLLAGCRSNVEVLVTVTPPVVEAVASATIPVAEVAETNTPTAPAEEPNQPTAIATAVSPTVTPLPALTPTPAPLTKIELEIIIPEGSLTKPVYLAHAFDERLFIVEQAGTIRIFENGALLDEPFLDIEDRVGSDASEQGLLSVAFHPEYGDNGRFFLNYTNKEGSTVIARYQVSDTPNLADSNSENILFTVAQPFANHNGGQLQFGPDGYLYIGMGDGGFADDPDDNGQTSSTLLGSMLRLDVNFEDNANFYAVPSTNPFVADDAIRNEIWAIGLRNPWRFSFDRETGDLFIADVGQNIYEEVHFQPANSTGGENYGWNLMEGLHCFKADECDSAGLDLPIFEYSHENGCSITGGYVYRGAQFPTLWGNYFVGDFCNGNVWALRPTADGSWDSTLLQSGRQLSSFGEDVHGELYFLDYTQGAVLQIQP